MQLTNEPGNMEFGIVNAEGEKVAVSDTLNELLNASPMAVHLYDKGIEPFDCNQTAVEMYGMNNKQEYLDNFSAFQPLLQPDGRQSKLVLQEMISETYETGKTKREVLWIKSNGAVIHSEVNCTRINYEDRQIVVTHTRELPSSGSSKEDWIADINASLMLDSTPLACFLVDRNFEAIDCNLEALNLFSIKCKIRALLMFHDICPDEPVGNAKNVNGVKSAIQKALTTGRYNSEFMCYDTMGKPIPCEVTLVRVYYRRDHIVAVYLQDQRPMQAMADEVKRIEVAEGESRAKSRFLAQMSHEIRTPMNAILGVAEIQLLGGNHEQEVEEAFLQIYTSSNLLISIINDLLDLSKFEAEKMKTLPVRYEMASLIIDTVQLNLMYVSDKDINFELSVNPNVPFALIGDELRIKQVMNNLLSNAFKYTNVGSVRLVITSEPTADPEKVTIVFSVRDTGQGMSRSQLDSLFVDEYVRHNEKDNRDIQGTGLGMSITRRLVDMLEGEIDVDSEPGMGTQFIIRIPQFRDGNKRLGEETATNLENLNMTYRSINKILAFTREPMPYGKVLVVDDVETNLHVAKGLLMPYGLQIETATSGTEAISLIEKGNEYDVVFMDHMMPDMDGLQATKILRDSGYKRAIVAFTANVLAGQSDVFLSNGFDGFISKPVDVHKLNDCLVNFVRNKQTRGAVEAVTVETQNKPVETISTQASVEHDTLTRPFLRDANKALGVIEEILSGGVYGAEKVKLFTINVHALKSVLALVGEMSLSAEAYTLEQAGISMRVGVIKRKAPSFVRELKKIITKYTPKETDESIHADDPPNLKEKLQVVKEAFEGYDVFTAQQTLEDLQKLPMSRKSKTIVSKLSEHLLLSEFDEGIELIDFSM